MHTPLPVQNPIPRYIVDPLESHSKCPTQQNRCCTPSILVFTPELQRQSRGKRHILQGFAFACSLTCSSLSAAP